MTGANTDKVEVAAYAKISADLMFVASRMFDGVTRRRDEKPLSKECFEAWALIRRFAQFYGENADLKIDGPIAWQLGDALVLAHAIYHVGEPAPPIPGICDCDMARRIHPVAALWKIDHPHLAPEAQA